MLVVISSGNGPKITPIFTSVTIKVTEFAMTYTISTALSLGMRSSTQKNTVLEIYLSQILQGLWTFILYCRSEFAFRSISIISLMPRSAF
jgi:hypothetical protein